MNPESAILNAIRLAASKAGATLFRNNTGSYMRDGVFIRYGLCVGSSDLVGWLPDGRFLALEVKTPTGRISPAQQNFIDAVNKAGGIAGVARSPEEARNIIKYGGL